MGVPGLGYRDIVSALLADPEGARQLNIRMPLLTAFVIARRKRLYPLQATSVRAASPVGWVAVTNRGRITYYVKPDFRRSLNPTMNMNDLPVVVSAAVTAASAEGFTVTAVVKPSNDPSKSVLRRAGFRESDRRRRFRRLELWTS